MKASDAVTLGAVLVVVLVLLRKPLADSVMRTLVRFARYAPSDLRLLMSRLLAPVTGAAAKHYWQVVRLYALKDLGRTQDALREMDRFLDELPVETCTWAYVNMGVDLYVHAGLYRRALDLTERWSEAARVHGRELDAISCAITRINQAEALHNLGHDDAALARLESVAEVAEGDPLAISGLRCLRAWILVHRGALEAARSELSLVDWAALSDYHAELNYTWAALERECGDSKRALEHAETGLRLARVASSRRNGKLLVAELAARAGDEARARDLFADAIGSNYRGQGGQGLLRYAKLSSTRDDVEVDHILELVLERDPESRFAVEAREMLRERRGGTTHANGSRLGA
jgi:tetratricopeptide (TPR) repeat protein